MLRMEAGTVNHDNCIYCALLYFKCIYVCCAILKATAVSFNYCIIMDQLKI